MWLAAERIARWSTRKAVQLATRLVNTRLLAAAVSRRTALNDDTTDHQIAVTVWSSRDDQFPDQNSALCSWFYCDCGLTRPVEHLDMIKPTTTDHRKSAGNVWEPIDRPMPLVCIKNPRLFQPPTSYSPCLGTDTTLQHFQTKATTEHSNSIINWRVLDDDCSPLQYCKVTDKGRSWGASQFCADKIRCGYKRYTNFRVYINTCFIQNFVYTRGIFLPSVIKIRRLVAKLTCSVGRTKKKKCIKWVWRFYCESRKA